METNRKVSSIFGSEKIDFTKKNNTGIVAPKMIDEVNFPKLHATMGTTEIRKVEVEVENDFFSQTYATILKIPVFPSTAIFDFDFNPSNYLPFVNKK